MSWLSKFSSLPPCNYVRTLPFNWKMVPVTELTPEQVEEIEDDLAFERALAFKFGFPVNDRVGWVILNKNL